MNQYRRSQKLFHWISAILILGLFAMGVWMRTLGYYDAWYQTAPDWHKQIGVLLLFIMIGRIVWRFKAKTPEPSAHHQPWEVKLAHITHWVLYLGIFLIIASGYLIATADNRGIDILGTFTMPVLFTPFENQEDIAGEIHEWGAYILMAVVALHVLGAIKHHLIDKDDTLKRML
ncbi:MAG: cytochrome b [Gammaproteobacteria bacterium]|nr:cytochrome b [Gammaproteobacteria bacterium]